ncbi:MAG: exodeoxyribonuclease VII large subunit [Lachnospiraceae bacterium]|nr:exodeoxyribonuclease VII large subunit [Lachnospiraceae bacterium]
MAGSVYSVGQVSGYIKNMFEQDFLLRRISVRGEISNCKYHTSGHIYFTLKDEKASMAAIMFAGNRRNLKFTLKDGQKVVVDGQITIYERDGRYQLYARDIRPDGVGELYRQYLLLKQDLEERGLFAPEYKQPIPTYARRVGIVTAPTGAAIRDIMQISHRRNPYVQLILYPALVQGAGAAPSIVRGIKTLDRLGVDCIIVGRGGGSIEDLWAFNEEIVAQAIFDCRTPIISAVGHETDYTIADFVSDLRAPTPSAAAELAVFDFGQFQSVLTDMHRRMCMMLENQIETEKNRLAHREAQLKLLHPRARLSEYARQVRELEEKLRRGVDRKLENERNRLMLYSERLGGLSPLNKLGKGYVYATDAEGTPVQQAGQLKIGDRLRLRLVDGAAEVQVSGVQLSDTIRGKKD